MKKWVRAVVVASLFITLLAELSARATPLHSSAFLTNGVRGEETVYGVGRDLEKISVFAYHITENGDVLPPSAWVPAVTDQLMADPAGHLILITVNNRVLGPDGKLTPEHGGATVKAILSDPAKRAEHIRQLAALAGRAHGIELNYERFTPDMRDLFSAFIRDLRGAMPAGKKLSIVLQPKLSGASGSNGNAVDWRAIEPYADYMRIMAYYYSWSTSAHGPVVPMETLQRLAEFATRDPVERIPRHKLSIILSLWGWDWPMPVGTPGTLVQFTQAMATASSHGVTPRRDPNELTLNFQYPGSDGVPHEVWIDDATSIRSRVDLLLRSGVPRVDFWHLNTGDPPLWDTIATRTAEARTAGLDFDGDGLSDLAVFRPATGTWFVDVTHDGGTDMSIAYGRAGDIPVPADYDGNGVIDLAVFRPSTATWFVDFDWNGGTDLTMAYGKPGDVPVPADYDGNGVADLAVFRPASGTWFVDVDSNGGTDLNVVYGRSGDIPVPGDYDGDGVTDLAVFRPASGKWFVDTNRNGGTNLAAVFGQSGDLPVPGDYDGDEHTDFAVFRPSWGGWYVDTNRNGGTDINVGFGNASFGDVPVPGNHDGDGVMDLGVFRPVEARWLVDTNLRGDVDLDFRYGAGGDVPLRAGGWILDALGMTP